MISLHRWSSPAVFDLELIPGEREAARRELRTLIGLLGESEVRAILAEVPKARRKVGRPPKAFRDHCWLSHYEIAKTADPKRSLNSIARELAALWKEPRDPEKAPHLLRTILARRNLGKL